MNRELDKNGRIGDVLRNEEDVIQKDVEELSKKRDHLKKIRDLKDKRHIIEEETEYIKGKRFDQVTFFDIMLFVIFVLLAGALLAEGRVIGRYAIIPLVVALIIAWKLIDKFA